MPGESSRLRTGTLYAADPRGSSGHDRCLPEKMRARRSASWLRSEPVNPLCGATMSKPKEPEKQAFKQELSVSSVELLSLRHQVSRLRKYHEEMIRQCDLVDKRLAVLLGFRVQRPDSVSFDGEEITMRDTGDPVHRARNLKRRRKQTEREPRARARPSLPFHLAPRDRGCPALAPPPPPPRP